MLFRSNHLEAINQKVFDLQGELKKLTEYEDKIDELKKILKIGRASCRERVEVIKDKQQW